MQQDKLVRQEIIDGGAVVYYIESEARQRGDGPKERAAKSRASSEAQRARNRILSTRKLELILAKNFPRAGSGLVITLTYDDAHLPGSRKQAQRKLKHFLDKLRRARRNARLPEPRAVYATEVLSSSTGRWHHHLVLDNTGRDLPMVRACWGYGSEIDCERLRVDREKNHESLARYMSKELREAQEYECRPGLHGWGCTRNCLRPEVDVRTVPARDRIRPPRGARVLMRESRERNVGSWSVTKYAMPPSCFPRPPRARRC